MKMNKELQSDLFDKLKQFIELQPDIYDEKFWTNFQSGLSSYLSDAAFYLSNSESTKNFLDIINTITSWDGTMESINTNKQLKETFENFIFKTNILKTPAASITIDQPSYDTVISPSTSKGVNLNKENEISFIFKDDELSIALKNLINKNRIISLGSANHTISLSEQEGKYYIFDPNDPQTNGRAFDSLLEVQEYFKRSCYYNFSPQAEFANFPVNISVFNKPDIKHVEILKPLESVPYVELPSKKEEQMGISPKEPSKEQQQMGTGMNFQFQNFKNNSNTALTGKPITPVQPVTLEQRIVDKQKPKI